MLDINLLRENPDVVRKAERVIFPGVGAAGSAMETLNERKLASPHPLLGRGNAIFTAHPGQPLLLFGLLLRSAQPWPPAFTGSSQIESGRQTHHLPLRLIKRGC